MRLLETEAKMVFKRYSITVPEGGMAKTKEEALVLFNSIGKDAVIKPLGVKRRGKASAIFFAKSEVELLDAVGRLLGSTINGKRIDSVIVERRVPHGSELYAAITVDYQSSRPVLILSRKGGVEIEETARDSPKDVIRLPIDIERGLDASSLDDAWKGIGMEAMLSNLYRIFREYDAETVEINPIAVSDKGLVALDAVLVINDDSLPRHKEYADMASSAYANELEGLMAKSGWVYTDLDGDIGLVCSGAGLAMATLDLIKIYGGRPANFMDLAQVDGDGLYKALDLLTTHRKGMRVILIHLFAGLNRCDVMADGIKRFVTSHDTGIPIVARVVGNMEEQGNRVFDEIHVRNLPVLEDAVKEAVRVSNNGDTNR